MFEMVVKKMATFTKLLKCLECGHLITWDVDWPTDPTFCPFCGKENPAAKGD